MKQVNSMFADPLENASGISSGFIISKSFEKIAEQTKVSSYVSSEALEIAKREAQRLIYLNRAKSKKIVFKTSSKRFNHGHFRTVLN